MTKRIEVSVLMCVYNEEICFLRQSIESILTQTFKDFEFIIICDNPGNEQIVSCLKEYEVSDGRIKLYINEHNLGLTKSLNIGLQFCCGCYIVRMDADDVSLPQRIERQYSYMINHPEVTILNTFAVLFGEGIEESMRTSPIHHKKIARILPYECVIIHPSVMINRNGFDIWYDEGQKRSQDYELWLRLLSMGARFHTLPEALIMYRISDNQISVKNRSQQQSDNRRARYRTFCNLIEAVGFTQYPPFSVSQSFVLYNLFLKHGYNSVEKAALFSFFYSIPHSSSHFLMIPICSLFYGFSLKQSAILSLSYFTRRWDCYHFENLSSSDN